jgi:glycosyltransferase involved in cell wall biosynthesis
MDLIHVHHPFLSGSLALRYCKPRNIPIIFTNHTRYDLYTQAYLPMLPDIVGETVMSSFLPVFCRQCALIIAPSAGLRKVLQNYGVESQIEIVPNGVDLSPYAQPRQPIERANFGIQPDDVILVYLGRLGPEKNLPFLLRAFGAVAIAYPNTHLLIIGDGKERENLEDRARHMQISHRIHFTGQVPYSSVPDYLAMADAFVTASVTEVHPLSVIEALAAGLPVLGVDSPGVGDSVDSEVNGILVHEDIAEFTAQMVRLVREHELRKQMSLAARESARKFDIQHTNRSMMDIYTRVLQSAKQPQRSLRSRIVRILDRWKLT